VRALRARLPEATYVGLGGGAMEAEGVALLAGLEDLAVMGFVEVVGRLGFFRRLERTVEDTLRNDGIDLVIPIDYPGFNMRVTATAHRLGIPVLYYIAPQVWASKEGRTRRLAATTDRMAVILPFEEPLLRRAGVRAAFVGHPLLDRPEAPVDGPALLRAAGLDPERPVLALLPGSRPQEIERHLNLFGAAARHVARAVPGLQPVLGRAPSVPRAALDEAGLPVIDDTTGLLRVARAALVKSGTATLEAALARVPFVVAYWTSPLTWAIARRVIKVEHVALANLVAGRGVVPELLQGEATPEALSAALVPLCEPGSAERAAQIEGLKEIEGRLGGPGASARVAEIAAELLEARA